MKKTGASCHCGGVTVSVIPRAGVDGTANIAFCHCTSCRHVTGELLVSYLPIQAIAHSDLHRTSRYLTADGWMRHFCSVCGCHVLRSRNTGVDVEWEVATGVLTGPLRGDTDNGGPKIRYENHVNVSSTKDGGSSAWLPEVEGDPMATHNSEARMSDNPDRPRRAPEDTLSASCDCGTVSFHITRPDAASSLPRSPFPDLTHPYSTTDPSIAANPGDEKWWLRNSGKYLAGTCACRTCRLVSGFEIQTWAFVPVSNIYFHVPSDEGKERTVVPLDFENLPAGILRSYRSSPDVAREFCGNCGATVFWRGVWRSELVDVSVGLLRGDGARAESWLEWWRERVSFSEETESGRLGDDARRARELIKALERGLKRWEQA